MRHAGVVGRARPRRGVSTARLRGRRRAYNGRRAGRRRAKRRHGGDGSWRRGGMRRRRWRGLRGHIERPRRGGCALSGGCDGHTCRGRCRLRAGRAPAWSSAPTPAPTLAATLPAALAAAPADSTAAGAARATFIRRATATACRSGSGAVCHATCCRLAARLALAGSIRHLFEGGGWARLDRRRRRSHTVALTRLHHEGVYFEQR